jgi:hypothetical protein
MAAQNSPVNSPQPNRRSRVRHHIQTPAFASFTSESKGSMLELHEIVNISEDGIALQCHTPLEKGRRLNLCLDLAECSDHIYTSGQVIWSNAAGLAGLRFSEMRPLSLFRLREWLFLNAMAGVAQADDGASLSAQFSMPIRPGYTDTLAAVTAVQREVEALGRDLTAALQLLATRAQTLLHASGAAIALADADPAFMVCRASAGPDAPPVGARLQLGSGFSGECVKSGKLLRCDDSETDLRVDRESCRALGIRSILAVPVRLGEKSIGIIEAFSRTPAAFSENDSRVLQRLGETVVAAVSRAARSVSAPATEIVVPAKPYTPAPGSVLFASFPEAEEKDKDKTDTPLADSEKEASSGMSLPRSHLLILIAAAATIALGLGYRLAPWIQAEVIPWAQTRLHAQASTNLPSVLASSRAPAPASNSSVSIETATLDQLRQMAEKGDPAAQNLLGLRYVSGEGVKADEHEAVRWFTKAAQQGNIPAQSKLGSLFFRGRQIPQNLNQAYFWMALARANGDENSKVLAPLVAARLTRGQVTSIELQANNWLEQHSMKKPAPGR